MFEQLKERAAALNLSKKEYKKMRRAYKNELVHRSALKKLWLHGPLPYPLPLLCQPQFIISLQVLFLINDIVTQLLRHHLYPTGV